MCWRRTWTRISRAGARAGAESNVAEQVFTNLRRALASVGVSFTDVMKTTTFVTDVKHIPALRDTRARYFDSLHPPANTLVPVAALARPDLLLEIEAVVDLSGRR